jgi:hypothetical protein
MLEPSNEYEVNYFGKFFIHLCISTLKQILMGKCKREFVLILRQSEEEDTILLRPSTPA